MRRAVNETRWVFLSVKLSPLSDPPESAPCIVGDDLDPEASAPLGGGDALPSPGCGGPAAWCGRHTRGF